MSKMSKYYITRVHENKVSRFARLHTKKTGIPYGEDWGKTWRRFIEWYGLRVTGTNKVIGVTGIMRSNTLPDELYIVCLYGKYKATKILLDYVLSYPQKHKFGSVEIRNKEWIQCLKKRGWEVEEVLPPSPSGSNSVVLAYKGQNHGK